MNESDRVSLLARAPIFHGLPEEILGRIAEVAEEVSIGPGEQFISADAVEPWMYLLVDGAASVDRDGQHIAIVQPGSTVGELAVLDPAPRSADVTATRPTRLLRIDHAHLAELMADSPELTDGIITVLVRMVRAGSDRMGPGSVSAI